MKKPRFPMLAVILLVYGIAWLLNDLNILVIDIPWVPVIIVIIAMGLIANRYGNC